MEIGPYSGWLKLKQKFNIELYRGTFTPNR
jgi:hypothetical protein